ncbi:MAG: class I SAM-dependent methyltransferase [Lachnospiraceae bacterium]|nr:class I SAM-dependent methyltransferase [Lachnospiraceae bacterium]
MKRTAAFYEENAFMYSLRTRNVNMTDILEVFAALLPPGGRVLDVGCGSGRDLKWFAQKGFRTAGLDASERMCELAREYAGAPVVCCRMEDWAAETAPADPADEDPAGSGCLYDGIWANASLLHLQEEDLHAFFRRAADRLRPYGVMYFSMKETPDEDAKWIVSAENMAAWRDGRGVTYRDTEGRLYRLFTRKDLREVLRREKRFSVIDSWSFRDRLTRDMSWRMVILERGE